MFSNLLIRGLKNFIDGAKQALNSSSLCLVNYYILHKNHTINIFPINEVEIAYPIAGEFKRIKEKYGNSVRDIYFMLKAFDTVCLIIPTDGNHITKITKRLDNKFHQTLREEIACFEEKFENAKNRNSQAQQEFINLQNHYIQHKNKTLGELNRMISSLS